MSDWPQRVPGEPFATLRLPIHGDIYEGLGTVGGMLSFDGRELVIEFQARDALFGLLRGEPKQYRVPLSAVESVQSGKGWFWLLPWIELQINDFALLTRLPGAHAGRWRARVSFADRVALARFAKALSFSRAGDLHERLERDLERQLPAAGMPPLIGDPEAARTPSRARELE